MLELQLHKSDSLYNGSFSNKRPVDLVSMATTACPESPVEVFLSFLGLYWNNLGFRMLLNRSVNHLTKKLLHHPDQHLVVGRKNELKMIAQSFADDVDW